MYSPSPGTVPEVYYLHEVCQSCTDLVHDIVPEVYYLHEVCHSCTHLVHGTVPEVYYLHEVCQSCTDLVHDIVPEVYYLHEVCHSCANIVQGIVFQEQWIWSIHDVLFHRLTCKVSKMMQWSLADLHVPSVLENCVQSCQPSPIKISIFPQKIRIFHNFSSKNMKLSFIHCTHYFYWKMLSGNWAKLPIAANLTLSFHHYQFDQLCIKSYGPHSHSLWYLNSL